MKSKALTNNDHFLPIISGSGAKIIPKNPPIDNKLPIQDNCSVVGIKSSGESAVCSCSFAIAGLDQPSI